MRKARFRSEKSWENGRKIGRVGDRESLGWELGVRNSGFRSEKKWENSRKIVRIGDRESLRWELGVRKIVIGFKEVGS